MSFRTWPAAGAGIWAALEEKQFYGLGCGANQNSLSPYIPATAGFVLTDIAYDQWPADHRTAPGLPANVYPSFSDGAFAYLTGDASVELPEDLLEKVDAAQEWYVNSGVSLPTTMDEVDGWIASTARASNLSHDKKAVLL